MILRKWQDEHKAWNKQDILLIIYKWLITYRRLNPTEKNRYNFDFAQSILSLHSHVLYSKQKIFMSNTSSCKVRPQSSRYYVCRAHTSPRNRKTSINIGINRVCEGQYERSLCVLLNPEGLYVWQRGEVPPPRILLRQTIFLSGERAARQTDRIFVGLIWFVATFWQWRCRWVFFGKCAKSEGLEVAKSYWKASERGVLCEQSLRVSAIKNLIMGEKVNWDEFFAILRSLNSKEILCFVNT